MTLLISTLTSKGQATIPADVRKVLGLKPGDVVEFKINPKDHQVMIFKLTSFDKKYYKALSGTLSEWDSPEDEEAYDDL